VAELRRMSDVLEGMTELTDRHRARVEGRATSGRLSQRD
jgi:hypothetical protein